MTAPTMNTMPRSRPTWRRLSATLAAIAMLTGCESIDWGTGVTESQLEPEAFGASDLVVVVTDDAIGSAAQRVNATLGAALEDGLEFAGWASISGGGGLGAEFSWDAMTVKLGPVQLALAHGGMQLTTAVAIPDTIIRLVQGDLFICNVGVALDDGSLTYGLTLGVDKLGRSQATLNGPVGFSSDSRNLDFAACTELLSEVDLDVWEDLLWQQLSTDLAAGFNEVVQQRLIRALGLDLATEWAGVVTTNANGTSRGRLEVRAESSSDTARPAAPGDGLPVGPLVVSFAVGIETDAHVCAPPLPDPLGETPGLAPPVGEVTDDALLVAHTLVERVIAEGHQAGNACGDQFADMFSSTASDLVAAWPELSRLTPDTQLSVRLWPIEAPLIAFDNDRVVASTGRIEVDLHADVDGVRVRLASLVVAAEVGGHPVVHDGWLTIEGDTTAVTSIKTTGGLFGEPPVALAELLAQRAADALLTERPLLAVPVRGASAPAAPLVSRDGYLIMPRG